MRLSLTCLLLTACSLLYATAGVTQPTEKVYEVVIGYGRSPSSSEVNAISAAGKASRGNYDLKSIRLYGKDNKFYCLLGIEYKVFTRVDKIKVQEVTVGYGQNWQRAEHSAVQKAWSLANRSAGGKVQTGNATGGVNTRGTSNYFKIKSISFSTLDDEVLCYIKFEYLRNKEA